MASTSQGRKPANFSARMSFWCPFCDQYFEVPHETPRCEFPNVSALARKRMELTNMKPKGPPPPLRGPRPPSTPRVPSPSEVGSTHGLCCRPEFEMQNSVKVKVVKKYRKCRGKKK
ncbi:hypothetical protein R5R35_011260 [Gryllus longicercus]|uniref:Uncharacterized protein n=1 Tax=Gryllus longicercus TaxID=2509291 RepID=A0AAN9VVZ3_9ORTH